MSNVAIALCVLSLFVFVLIGKQISKNQLELADMRDRVAAIRGFQRDKGRIPSEAELAGISRELPSRYFFHLYRLYTAPTQFYDANFTKEWPAAGGWVLLLWRGEWAEYYTSWDDHYTMADQLFPWSFPLFWAAAGGLAIAAWLFGFGRKRAPP